MMLGARASALWISVILPILSSQLIEPANVCTSADSRIQNTARLRRGSVINMGPLQLGILCDLLGALAIGVEELCSPSQASAPTSST